MAHIVEKRCPALVCKDLIAYYILPEKCERACEHCVLSCPVKAISADERRIKVIDQEKCTKCGNCILVCPKEYNAVVKMTPASSVPVTKVASVEKKAE
jgi:NADH-quinone oxidoreductase subunit F